MLATTVIIAAITATAATTITGIFVAPSGLQGFLILSVVRESSQETANSTDPRCRPLGKVSLEAPLYSQLLRTSSVAHPTCWYRCWETLITGQLSLGPTDPSRSERYIVDAHLSMGRRKTMKPVHSWKQLFQAFQRHSFSQQIFHAVLVCSGCHNKIPQARQHKQQTFIFSESGGWKSKIKMLAGLVFSEASTFGLRIATLLLLVHMVVPLRV